VASRQKLAERLELDTVSAKIEAAPQPTAESMTIICDPCKRIFPASEKFTVNVDVNPNALPISPRRLQLDLLQSVTASGWCSPGLQRLRKNPSF
jgi:hypothetical protein